MVQILARRAGAGQAAAAAGLATPPPVPPVPPAAAPAPAKLTKTTKTTKTARTATRPPSDPGQALAGTRAAVAPRKLLASLRKMGDSLPTKQGRLLSILKSLLGPDAGAADALAALASLVTAGQVVVAPGGAVSYRL